MVVMVWRFYSEGGRVKRYVGGGGQCVSRRRRRRRRRRGRRRLRKFNLNARRWVGGRWCLGGHLECGHGPDSKMYTISTLERAACRDVTALYATALYISCTICVSIYECAFTHRYTHTHTHTHTHTVAHSHTHTKSHTHAHTHTATHAYTHRHGSPCIENQICQAGIARCFSIFLMSKIDL